MTVTPITPNFIVVTYATEHGPITVQYNDASPNAWVVPAGAIRVLDIMFNGHAPLSPGQ